VRSECSVKFVVHLTGRAPAFLFRQFFILAIALKPFQDGTSPSRIRGPPVDTPVAWGAGGGDADDEHHVVVVRSAASPLQAVDGDEAVSSSFPSLS